ncbi:MAG: hypothetical protein KAT70_01850, partial [Thermoplasmata archaeon]|nr:hypothetical protein [Thermoplasmata archaeon]
KPCNVTAVVTDNVGVENVSIEIIPSGSVANPDGSITILSIEDDDPRWSVLFVCHEPGDYFVKVHVRDVNGNEHIMEKDGNGKVVTFKVLADTAPPQAAPIFLSSGGDLAYNLSFNEDNRVTWLNHSYQNSSTGEWPNSLQNNTEANFTAVIVDNTGVASANLTIAEKGDDNSGETYELILWEGNWTANFTLPGPGEYNLIIRSTDVNGNTHVLKVDYYGDRLSIWVR